MEKSLLSAILFALVLPLSASAQQGKDQSASSYAREQAVGLNRDPIQPDRATLSVKEEPAFRNRQELYLKKNIGVLKSGEPATVLVKLPEANFESTSSVSFSDIEGISSITVKSRKSLEVTFNGKKPLGNFSEIVHIVPTTNQGSSYQVTLAGDVVETTTK